MYQSREIIFLLRLIGDQGSHKFRTGTHRSGTSRHPTIVSGASDTDNREQQTRFHGCGLGQAMHGGHGKSCKISAQLKGTLT